MVDYIDIRELIRLYPFLTKSTVKRLIKDKNANGFEICVRYLGNKIIISKKDFVEWLDSQTKKII